MVLIAGAYQDSTEGVGRPSLRLILAHVRGLGHAPYCYLELAAMDEPVRLAIVGCGGMGRRHLAGLAELSRTSHMNMNLVAVCDPNRRNAEDLAEEAHELLGERPAVFEA